MGRLSGDERSDRAVTRRAVWHSSEVLGVRHGYAGLIEDDFIPLTPRDVGRISHLGGTMLGSARCEEFRTERGIAQAMATLAARSIEGLVVIGGNARKPARTHYRDWDFQS